MLRFCFFLLPVINTYFLPFVLGLCSRCVSLVFSVEVAHSKFPSICKFMSLISYIYIKIVFIVSLALHPNPAIGKCFFRPRYKFN